MRTKHFSASEQAEIFRNYGMISADEAEVLAAVTAGLPFVFLDGLYDALNVIRKGEHDWRSKFRLYKGR